MNIYRVRVSRPNSSRKYQFHTDDLQPACDQAFEQGWEKADIYLAKPAGGTVSWEFLGTFDLGTENVLQA